MLEKDISFNKAYKYKAEIHLADIGSKLSGTLEFSDNKLPVFTTGSVFDINTKELESLKSFRNKVECITDGYTFTLFDYDILGNSLYPKYISRGNSDDTFTSVEILLTGFSTWFNQKKGLDFETDENKIIKNLHQSKFSEKINIDGEKYLIKSNLCYQTKRLEKQNFLITEYTSIIIESQNKNISCEFANEISHKIRILFSLLLGYNLSFENVWLLSEKKRRVPFYFCHPGEEKDPFEHNLECTLLPQYIDNNLWHTIFSNFFSTKSFDKIWARLPFMFSYQGAWEYELLGYISLLDAYSSEFTDKKRKKLPRSKYRLIQNDLLNVIKKHEGELGSDFSSVLDSFSTAISGIRNTNLPTFKEKFYALVESIDSRVYSTIDLSDEQFMHIKKLRDLSAHGQPVITLNPRSINYEFIVRDKIRLLLTYLYYRDLGIDSEIFALSLRRTSNKVVRNADINNLSRDRIVGDIPEYVIDEENFKKFPDRNWLNIVINYSESTGIYSINDLLTNSLNNDWLRNTDRKYNTTTDYVKSRLEQFISVEYISRVYLLCNDKSRELHGICLVTTE